MVSSYSNSLRIKRTNAWNSLNWIPNAELVLNDPRYTVRPLLGPPPEFIHELLLFIYAFAMEASFSTKDKSIDYRRPYAGILYHCYFENAPTKAPLDEGAFTAVYFFQPSHLYLFRRVTRRVRASCVGRIQNPPSVEPPYNTSVDGSNLESSVELSHNTSARHST